MEADVIGKIIARLRRESNLTQEELAQKLGVSFQAVSKWENGASFPDITLIPKISDCFGVSIDYLFGKNTSIESENIEDSIIRMLAETDTSSRYNRAFQFYKAVYDGVSRKMLYFENPDENQCTGHVSEKEGIMLISYKGYGALVEDRYFRHINIADAGIYSGLMSVFADADYIRLMLAMTSLEKPTKSNIAKAASIDEPGITEKLMFLKDRRLIEAIVSKDSLDEVLYRINHMIQVPVMLILCTCRMIASEIYNIGISCMLSNSRFEISMESNEQ